MLIRLLLVLLRRYVRVKNTDEHDRVTKFLKKTRAQKQFIGLSCSDEQYYATD